MLRGLMKFFLLTRLFGGGRRSGGRGCGGGCGMGGLVLIVIIVAGFLLLRGCGGGAPMYDF